MEQKKHNGWGSTFGFLMAAIGSAVGLGNIWGFPYKMGANGGFPFLIMYFLVAIFVGFVVMLAEMALGRKTGKGPVGTYYELSRRYRWVGWFGVLSAFIITSFYSVLGAYCIKYAVLNIADIFGIEALGSAGMNGAEVFTALITNQPEGMFYTFVFMFVTAAIVMGGIKSGIERFSKIVMPALFVMMVIVIIRSVTLPGAEEGIRFMFDFNLEPLKENFFGVLSTAGGQVFFSLSLGMGIMMTYGAYLAPEHNMQRDTIVIIIADTIVAIMSGLAVLPAAFALGGEGAQLAGPKLLYITMQNVFDSMGKFGPIFGALFYILVVIAAVTSSISLVEVVTKFFIDRAKVKGKEPKRGAVTFWSCLAITALAMVVAADGLGSNGLWIPGQKVFGVGAWNSSWLDFMDAWSEGVMMPLGAFFLCMFVAYEYGMDRFGEAISLGGHKFRARGFCSFCIHVIAPIGMLMVLYGQLTSFFGSTNLALGGIALVIYIVLAMIPVGIAQKKGYCDSYQVMGFFLFSALTAVVPALVVTMCLNDRTKYLAK